MFTCLINKPIPQYKTHVISWGEDGRKIKLYPVPAAFDIETTNDAKSKAAFMYHWQFAIADSVYAGRSWDDLFLFLDYIKQPAMFGSGHIIVYIHNMDFEMSFLIPQLFVRDKLARVFAKSEHAPLEVETTNGIIFRDSKALTNMSLSSLAKNYTKTQKMVGDLDYSIPRNSTTPLTDKELQYCINDVVILKEYAEQLHAEYTENDKRIPLTSTGIVRQYIKEQIPFQKRFAIHKQMEKLFPKTEQQYKNTMQWLFRGGYTHAQTGACDEILHNVVSYDFTSAYPSIMIHEMFPVTPFRTLRDKSLDNIIYHIKTGAAIIMMAEFTNIKAKTPHCVESKSKIMDFKNAIFENGRLYSADSITVLLTDVDFNIYADFYNWSNIKIISAKIAHKGRLPDYLFKSVLEFYKNKKELKERVKRLERAGADASEVKKLLQKTKGMLNSCYGMTVSRLNFGEWHYGYAPVEDVKNEDDDDPVIDWYVTYEKTYEQLKKNQFLSPYWGIYVTAYCRRDILAAIRHFGEYAIYSDTDSIKLLDTAPGLTDYFDVYNLKIETYNNFLCDRYGLSRRIYADLGTFDNEGKYTRFKTLGAKRYIYEKDGHIEAVIAGLPKTVSQKYAEENGNDALFTKFAPDMWFEEAGKNAHIYTGEVSADIAGEIMHELGSCYIYETSFKMTVQELFLSQIYERKDEFKHGTE